MCQVALNNKLNSLLAVKVDITSMIVAVTGENTFLAGKDYLWKTEISAISTAHSFWDNTGR